VGGEFEPKRTPDSLPYLRKKKEKEKEDGSKQQLIGRERSRKVF